MSRTWKDRPYRLGGKRRKWFIVGNHWTHGRFTKLMRRLARRDLGRAFKADPDSAPRRSKHQKQYFD